MLELLANLTWFEILKSIVLIAGALLVIYNMIKLRRMSTGDYKHAGINLTAIGKQSLLLVMISSGYLIVLGVFYIFN